MKVVAVDLKEKRLEHGWTQAQLAERLGVYPQHVYKLEAGLRNITASLIADCVDLFGSLKWARRGRVYVTVPADRLPTDTLDDHPKPHRDPFATLNDTERIVRLSKELGDVQACTSDLPRCLLNPQARREHMKRLLKEGLEADMILEALLASADPALLSEAAAMSASELAAECGEVA